MVLFRIVDRPCVSRLLVVVLRRVLADAGGVLLPRGVCVERPVGGRHGARRRAAGGRQRRARRRAARGGVVCRQLQVCVAGAVVADAARVLGRRAARLRGQ